MGLAAPSPIPWAGPREGRPLGRQSGARGTGGHLPPFRNGFVFWGVAGTFHPCKPCTHPDRRKQWLHLHGFTCSYTVYAVQLFLHLFLLHSCIITYTPDSTLVTPFLSRTGLLSWLQGGYKAAGGRCCTPKAWLPYQEQHQKTVSSSPQIGQSKLYSLGTESLYSLFHSTV